MVCLFIMLNVTFCGRMASYICVCVCTPIHISYQIYMIFQKLYLPFIHLYYDQVILVLLDYDRASISIQSMKDITAEALSSSRASQA